MASVGFKKKPVNYNPKVLPRSQDAVPIIQESTGLYGIKSKTLKIVQEEKEPSQLPLLRFFVQVSSFRNQKKAGALKIKLQEKGFDSFLIDTELPNHEGKWYRVFLGKYSDEELASKAVERARKEFRLNAVVVKKTLG